MFSPLVIICITCYTRKEGRKEGSKKGRNVLFNDALNTFYFILYGIRQIVKDHLDREETRCHHHMGCPVWLAAGVLLYAPSHKQDSTYLNLYYTSYGALAGMRNSSAGPPPWEIDPTSHCTMSWCSTIELHLTPSSYTFMNTLPPSSVHAPTAGCQPYHYTHSLLCAQLC